MTNPVVSRAAVIGLGLIGGSVAAALRQQGCYVSSYDIDVSNTASGLDLGIIDNAAETVSDAAEGAELIVVAVPILSMKEVFSAIEESFDQPHIAITDVGSVKGEVLNSLKQVAGKIPNNFVPGHPIAGSEMNGIAAADADLFRQHQVILTPLENTFEDSTSRVVQMWQSFGADVSSMQVDHHDIVLAQTSHLPHLLAYALIDTLSSQGNSLEIFDHAAGGLRDFSRIASSDPTMWRDILTSNSGPLLAILDQYMAELAELREIIEQDRTGDLFDLLERAKQARDHFSRILEKRS